MTTDIDRVATTLMQMGRMARSMPPSWDGAKCRTLVAGPSFEHVGYLLPGRGLQLDCDLKYLGIKKPLPYVYQKTLREKLMEILKSERGAIATYDGIINARASGQFNDIVFTKTSLTTVANQWFSILRAGGDPAAMVFNSATPPTEAATSVATTGALSTGLSNPSGSNRKYLLTLGFGSGSTINFALLVDIHVQGGSFRLTVTTAETVASPVTVVRQYGTGGTGAGNCISFVETTASSATAHTLTVSYVNSAGTSTSVAFSAPATAGTIDGIYPVGLTNWFVPLASGDFGVRSVSQTQSNTALAAGVLALILHYPLMLVPGISSNVYVERDSTVQVDALTELANSAQVIGCLGMLVFANTTSSGQLTGMMRTCEG